MRMTYTCLRRIGQPYKNLVLVRIMESVGVLLIIHPSPRQCCLERIRAQFLWLCMRKKLEFVKSYKYLGLTVTSGNSISFSNLKPLIKFRQSVNTILNVRLQPSEPVLLKLLYTMCVPHLTYACETLDYTSSQMNQLNVALNDSLRKIFSYNRWESIRFLRMTFGYPSVTDIFFKRSASFLKQIPMTGNRTLIFLSKLWTVGPFRFYFRFY